MKWFIIENRVKQKQLIDNRRYEFLPNEIKQNYIAFDDVYIALDKLEEEGFDFSQNVDLNNGIICAKELRECLYNIPREFYLVLKPKIKSIEIFRKSNGMFKAINQILIYDRNFINQLCNILNISFSKYTKEYNPIRQDRFYLITKENLQNAINETINSEQGKILINQKLIGRNQTGRRTILDFRMIPYDWHDYLLNIPQQNNYYNYDLILTIFRRAYYLSTGNNITIYDMPDGIFI